MEEISQINVSLNKEEEEIKRLPTLPTIGKQASKKGEVKIYQ